jgi:predicted alpha/beta hydrolase family esterase
LDDDVATAEYLKYQVLDLPARHNAIRNRLNATRAHYIVLSQNYSFLMNDQNVAPQFIAAITELNTTIDDYAKDNYLQYASFEDRLSLIENTTVLESALADRTATIVFIGKALLQSELDVQCAANVTGSCRNASANTVPTICTELLQNMTLSASSTYASSYCIQNSITIDNQTLFEVNETPWPIVISTIDTTLSDNLAQCCVFGKCQACCTTDSCKDDAATYPVVFVHGHAFNAMNTPEYSLGGYFADIQKSLESEGYIDAGIITPSSLFSEVSAGEWGLSGKPVSARVTYYYNFYKDGEEYVLIAQKSESIETYAIRLNEMVNIVKHHTGKKKVNIVAHSMGGLVVRRYLQLFGDESVDKVILIGTPNNGTQGRTNTLCPVFGENKECADMAQGSVFMSKVNDPVAQPVHAKFTTIAGSGCDVADEDGDGVVTVHSVALPFAKNYVVNGTCSDLLNSDLHTELLNINAHPRTYEIIRSVLQAK